MRSIATRCIGMAAVAALSFAAALQAADLFKLGTSALSQFTNDNGIHQDGNLAFCYDTVRSPRYFWGILSTTTSGGMKIWRGRTIGGMTFQYDAALDFKTGAAGTAFDNVSYPDCPRSRGHIWPDGLFIDSTGVWWCLFHNETGWLVGGTGYNVNKGGDPGEPDFRHIGLMSSSNQGKNWKFVKWIITGNPECNCYTTTYQPDSKTFPNPQPGPRYCLGAGDHAFFDNPNDNFLYIFYSMSWHDSNGKNYADRIYAARASKRDPATWKKYYNGAWESDGNRGLETPALGDTSCIPNVVYSSYLRKYFMSTYNRGIWQGGGCGKCALQISTSTDLVNWSPPEVLKSSDKTTCKPYWTMIKSPDSTANFRIAGRVFNIYFNQWGDNVRMIPCTTLAASAVKPGAASAPSARHGIDLRTGSGGYVRVVAPAASNAVIRVADLHGRIIAHGRGQAAAVALCGGPAASMSSRAAEKRLLSVSFLLPGSEHCQYDALCNPNEMRRCRCRCV